MLKRERVDPASPLPCLCCVAQGMLTFEGDAAFMRNEVRTEDSVEQGKAGAVSNTGSGTIHFKGKLTMEENRAEVRLELRTSLSRHIAHH